MHARFASALTITATIALMSAGQGQSQTRNRTVAHSPPSSSARPTDSGLSRLPAARPEVFEGAAKQAPGSIITGMPGVSSMSPDGSQVIGPPENANEESPQAFGTSTAPYTTVRAAVTAWEPPESADQDPVVSYPFRAIGKLRVRFGTQWFNCTAATIKRGVLVTAAHCVFNYGQKDAGWADQAVWYPANFAQSGQPYGQFPGGQFRILVPVL